VSAAGFGVSSAVEGIAALRYN